MKKSGQWRVRGFLLESIYESHFMSHNDWWVISKYFWFYTFIRLINNHMCRAHSLSLFQFVYQCLYLNFNLALFPSSANSAWLFSATGPQKMQLPVLQEHHIFSLKALFLLPMRVLLLKPNWMEFLISVASGGLTVICSKVVELYRLLREPELDVLISLKTDRDSPIIQVKVRIFLVER